MNRMPTSPPTSQCVGEWNPTAHRAAATTRPAPARNEFGSTALDGHDHGEHTDRDLDEEDAVPGPDGQAEADTRAEGLPVDPAHLLRVSLDQVFVTLDQGDDPPEAEPAEVGVSGVNRCFDPVELGSQAPGGTSSRFHGCLQVRRYDAPDALRPALERFPREESTIARSITQPAPPHGGGHAFVTLDGRYHMVERIAAGGMGEVFRAQDAVLAREVAIKVLHRSLAGDPAFVDRFRREARAAAGLAHPNIVNVYDWGAVDGVYYMVMEYVRGPSVRPLLNEQGRMEPAQAAEILRQSLLALGHAHHEGFVHRDIKPENLLLTQDGVVKVADFGLARAYADGRVTQAGAVTGTVQYLAPEQIRGEPADPRSDLYPLGIVAYELLTGKLPFTGETAMAVAYKHLSDRVPAPSTVLPDLPPELDGFVAAATDRDRELRPESADVMRMDLDVLSHQLPPARKLSALVHEIPSVTVEAGETTEVGVHLDTSIPRMERHRSAGGSSNVSSASWRWLRS